MSTEPPVLLSLALDTEANDVVRSAAELARAMDAPLATVHALGWRPLESDAHLEKRIGAAREELLEHLSPWVDEGVEVLEPIVRQGRPADVAVETAGEAGAQMIVTGGGGPATVRRWVLGSTAERIVRASPVPVYVARGVPPQSNAPILCPIDLSPQSRVGLSAAMRMARLFDAPLVTLTVIPEEQHGWMSASDLEHELAREESTARDQVAKFLAATDFEGLEVETRVVVGSPAERIVEASEEAWLLVIASRGFVELIPGTLGGVTERALRFSRCSALTVRDADPGRDEREKTVRRLADLKTRAEKHLRNGEPEKALPLLQIAVAGSPANAALQDALAEALEAVGREDEAAGRRHLAKVIRSSFG
jgi:nucleotide-binding universal stress UspA family protein